MKHYVLFATRTQRVTTKITVWPHEHIEDVIADLTESDWEVLTTYEADVKEFYENLEANYDEE
jgi:ADP-heptose:LPS heptosyltransferase